MSYPSTCDVAAATQWSVDRGRTVLQLFLFGETESEHVHTLTTLMRPRQGARILDVGCGIGAVSRLMRHHRPDCEFLLLNDNAWQLTQCEGETICADMHAIPLAEASVDVVMVNYALGYADLPRFLREAARVVRPDGTVFICDMEDASPVLAEMAYATWTALELAQAAAGAGLRLTDCMYPPASLDSTYRVVEWPPLLRLAADVRPVVWRLAA